MAVFEHHSCLGFISKGHRWPFSFRVDVGQRHGEGCTPLWLDRFTIGESKASVCCLMRSVACSCGASMAHNRRLQVCIGRRLCGSSPRTLTTYHEILEKRLINDGVPRTFRNAVLFDI